MTILLQLYFSSVIHLKHVSEHNIEFREGSERGGGENGPVLRNDFSIINAHIYQADEHVI